MKKTLSFLLISAAAFSLDFSTEIDTKYKTDFSSSETPISLNFSGTYSNDKSYAQFEVKGDSVTEEIELNKAYGEVYKDKLTLTFGRQPVSWGNAYIFNKMNALTSIDILKPNEKNTTLDGIKLKYSMGDSSRVEGIVFNVNDSADNYALRYTTLIKNYEMMFNYIKKEADSSVTGSEGVNDFIFDIKGDMVAGVWAQYAYNFDKNKSFYLLGSDYSFSLYDKTMYLLWEGSYDDSKELLLDYFRYEYAFDEWNSLAGGVMIQEKNSILTTTFGHKINDEVELNLSHILTSFDESSSVGSKLSKTYAKNNLELQIKAVF